MDCRWPDSYCLEENGIHPSPLARASLTLKSNTAASLLVMEILWSPGILLIIAQIACVIHLLRNDRSWLWLIALILVPFFGVIAYFLVEVLPEWRGRKRGGVELREESPRETSVRELEALLEASPTVENRAKLARACLRKNQPDRAVALYEECLRGVYADDLPLWYEAAEAYHAAGRPEQTLGALDRLDEGDYRDYRDRRRLLRALALEGVGRREEARDHLAAIEDTYPSVQPRYEYARVLLELGDKERARQVVADIFEQRSRHDRRYRQREAHWYKLARKLPVE